MGQHYKIRGENEIWTGSWKLNKITGDGDREETLGESNGYRESVEVLQ